MKLAVWRYPRNPFISDTVTVEVKEGVVIFFTLASYLLNYKSPSDVLKMGIIKNTIKPNLKKTFPVYSTTFEPTKSELFKILCFGVIRKEERGIRNKVSGKINLELVLRELEHAYKYYELRELWIDGKLFIRDQNFRLYTSVNKKIKNPLRSLRKQKLFPTARIRRERIIKAQIPLTYLGWWVQDNELENWVTERLIEILEKT